MEDPALAGWVNKQRCAEKKFDHDGSRMSESGMTAARVERLTELGFVWVPDVFHWDAQCARLEAYKEAHGDCNVPRGWVDPALARWVTKQRWAKKKFDHDGSTTTAARVERLTELGFASWFAHVHLQEHHLPWLGAHQHVSLVPFRLHLHLCVCFASCRAHVNFLRSVNRSERGRRPLPKIPPHFR